MSDVKPDVKHEKDCNNNTVTTDLPGKTVRNNIIVLQGK